MSWPATTDANNFRQTYLKGFLDLSGGDITNRTGGLFIQNDISSNSNIYAKNHVSVGTNHTSFIANSLKLQDEKLIMTIPLFLNSLKYFSLFGEALVGEFDISDSETDTDKTFYVKNNNLGPALSPFFLFSLEPNVTAFNDANTNGMVDAGELGVVLTGLAAAGAAVDLNGAGNNGLGFVPINGTLTAVTATSYSVTDAGAANPTLTPVTPTCR